MNELDLVTVEEAILLNIIGFEFEINDGHVIGMHEAAADKEDD